MIKEKRITNSLSNILRETKTILFEDIEIKFDLKKLSLSFLVTLSLITVYLTIFFLSDNKFIPKLSKTSYNIFNLDILDPLSLLTATFFHINWNHVSSNCIGLLIIGIPFFYFFGIKRGFLFYVMIAFASGLLEYAFIEINNLFLILFINYYKGCSYIDPRASGPVPCLRGGSKISGVGVSGVIVGYEAILVILLVKLIVILWEKKQKYNSGLAFLGLVIYLSSIVERICSDFSQYFNYISGLLIQYKNDPIVTIFRSLNQLLLGFIHNNGNPNLAHVFGILIGLIIGKYLLSRVEINISYKN